MKTICTVLSTVLLVFLALPAHAIVHHCDYTPASVAPEVHDRHSGENGCGNVDASGEGHDGYCDISTLFFWADMNCTADGCTMAGTIDCAGGDRFYSFDCPGSGSDKARVEQTRTEATCDSPVAGQDHSCACSGSCS